MHILDKIVAAKKKEIRNRKDTVSIPMLERSEHFARPKISLRDSVLQKDGEGIIAEFKRKSPSKPSINLNGDVQQVTRGYLEAGVSGLSVLTDTDFFGGSSNDLMTARIDNPLPILRKDFIIDEYQIIEASSIGADAILLISEILTKREVAALSSFARSLGLEVLLEMHSEEHLDKYDGSIELIGVNNRNLDTFKTDIQFSRHLIDKLPTEVAKISESGIHHPQVVYELGALGFDGFLIGEKFMMEQDPALACRAFIQQIKQLRL